MNKNRNIKKIFLINGSGGKGKDSFVEFCSEYTNVFNISSVDKIKEAATILGWNGGKTEKDRLFLSNMKLLSTRYNNNPYNYILDMVAKFQNSEASIMFIHIREIKEIDKVKSTIPCQTILVKNNNVEDIKSNMADSNVNNYDYDYVIDNNGTLEDLDNIAKEFVLSTLIWGGC